MLYAAVRDNLATLLAEASEVGCGQPTASRAGVIPLATEGVEVHIVSGNHVTMLAEPHVRSLASKVCGAVGIRS